MLYYTSLCTVHVLLKKGHAVITDTLVATARHHISATQTKIQANKHLFRAPGVSRWSLSEWHLQKQMNVLMKEVTDQTIMYTVILMEDGRLRARQYTLQGKLLRTTRETKRVTVRVKLIRIIRRRITLAQSESQRLSQVELLLPHDALRSDQASKLIKQLTAELHELGAHI